MSLLKDLPDDVEVVHALAGELDVIHVFVATAETLQKQMPDLLKNMKADIILWVSYPKTSSDIESDLKRDRVADIVQEDGLKAVAQISVDEDWSAIRFKLREDA